MSSDRENILLLFDVDGTVTQPRQAISERLRHFLLREARRQVAALGLVSGSDRAKLEEQLGGAQHLDAFDYVFCENGLVHYAGGALKSCESILTTLGEQKLQKLINFALAYLSKIVLPVKRGNFIEFRSSMINICPVGRSCSQAEREQFAEFDVKHQIRQKFVKALEAEFAGSALTFAMGGQISIDVFPTGWDKTYCLNHLASAKFKEIHFFGDKTDPGGNDYEIYSDERTIGHRVSSPEDTEKQLRLLLNLP